MTNTVPPGSSSATLRARSAWSIPGFAVERPSGDPKAHEIWCYTDRFGYDPGDSVNVRVHATATRYDVRVVRDGANPLVVWEHAGLAGVAHSTPENAYEVGCGWPVGFIVPIGNDWPSGLYLVILNIDADGRNHEREGFFVVRAPKGARKGPHVLVLTTSTLNAYNDWGGANHYRGLGNDPYTDIPAPVLSTQTPIPRGMLRQRLGVPRASNPHTPGPGYIPRRPAYEGLTFTATQDTILTRSGAPKSGHLWSGPRSKVTNWTI